MHMFAVGTLLWTAYCIYAWATYSGIWRITRDVLRQVQPGTPDATPVAFVAWGFGLGAMLAIAWPLSRLLRHR
jgi:hypothetical protein